MFLKEKQTAELKFVSEMLLIFSQTMLLKVYFQERGDLIKTMQEWIRFGVWHCGGAIFTARSHNLVQRFHTRPPAVVCYLLLNVMPFVALSVSAPPLTMSNPFFF